MVHCSFARQLERELAEARAQVRVLRGALVEVKQVLSCSMLSATEENCIDGPWLPAGVCCKIYDALAATEGLENNQAHLRRLHPADDPKHVHPHDCGYTVTGRICNCDCDRRTAPNGGVER
jgi:hypothetical protein